tara:strand:- start:534 stop:1085 length:552 start_codon:yes stop_codon:yes gene_type:complete
MEDYINGDWLNSISINFNKTIAKNAEKIIKKCEPKIRNFGHQWYANFAGYKVILLKPGEGYEWHFDNMNYINGELSCPRPERYWSEIIYLSDGQPFQVGNWNPNGERVEQTEFSAPEPTEILATIYPEPGKVVITPCFMVHRIKPMITKNRWAIVTFIDNPYYKDKTKKDLENTYKRYFNVDI